MYTNQKGVIEKLNDRISEIIKITNWDYPMPDRDIVISLVEVKGELMRSDVKLKKMIHTLTKMEDLKREQEEYDNQINQPD